MTHGTQNVTQNAAIHTVSCLKWTDLAQKTHGLLEHVEIWLCPTMVQTDVVELSQYYLAASLPWSALTSPESPDGPLESAFATLNGQGNPHTWATWLERSLSTGDVLRFCVAGERVTVRLEAVGWCKVEATPSAAASAAALGEEQNQPLTLPHADTLRTAERERLEAESRSDQFVAEWAVQQQLETEKKARARPEIYGLVTNGRVTYRHTRPLNASLVAALTAQGYRVEQKQISGTHPWQICLSWL